MPKHHAKTRYEEITEYRATPARTVTVPLEPYEMLWLDDTVACHGMSKTTIIKKLIAIAMNIDQAEQIRENGQSHHMTSSRAYGKPPTLGGKEHDETPTKDAQERQPQELQTRHKGRPQEH